ncbi:MAG: SMC family ATPase, partial [Planctomycetota bacterium]
MQISGFLSYMDKVELDFTDFDLACISGANGAGKSSLLDAMTWVLFGEARRKDDAIINHRADSCEVVFDFDYENVRYRIQRIKPRDKSTILEFFIRSKDGAWKPLTEATLRATEDRIRKSLRLDYETFTNASFFLQGKADQFAQQRPGDRKRILSGILGLEVWEQYKDETSRRRRGLETDLSVIDGILAEIDLELKEESARKARLTVLEKTYADRKALFEARKALLDQQRLIADRVAGERRQVEKQAAEIQRLQVELEKMNEDLRVRQEERFTYQHLVHNADQIEKEVQKWEKARKTLEEWDKVAANFHQYQSQRQVPLLKIEGERASLQTELDALIAK